MYLFIPLCSDAPQTNLKTVHLQYTWHDVGSQLFGDSERTCLYF